MVKLEFKLSDEVRFLVEEAKKQHKKTPDLQLTGLVFFFFSVCDNNAASRYLRQQLEKAGITSDHLQKTIPFLTRPFNLKNSSLIADLYGLDKITPEALLLSLLNDSNDFFVRELGDNRLAFLKESLINRMKKKENQ